MTETEDLKNLVHIRSFNQNDYNFILSTWLRGLYFGNTWQQTVTPAKGAPVDFFSNIDKDTFMAKYHNVIDRILNKTTTQIKVVSLKEDPDVIIGYAVIEPQTLHWVWVKEPWRKLGIASLMVDKDEINTFTHFTRLGMSIKPKAWKFNPFQI